MLKQKTVYFWASDMRMNSGEGMLALKFIKDLKKKFKKYKFISINNVKIENYNSFYS